MMERLETDRELFKRTLASRGLAVAPWRVVYGIDALVKILKAEKRLWIKLNNSERGIKETFFHEDWSSSVTTVDKLAHDLGFLRDVCFFMIEGEVPGVEPGSDYFYNRGAIFPRGLYGWEKKGDAYLCTVRDVDKLPQAVTKVQQAMAPLYKKHNLCGGISYEVRQGKENIPYYIDACFDDKTEILTDSGWKYFCDLNQQEAVATLNTDTGVIEYQRPTDYIVNEYDGKLINISNREKSIECTVTPNHQVLRTDRTGKRIFKERADALTDKGFIPRSGIWEGEDSDSFVLPAYHHEWNFKGQYGHIICKKVKDEPERRIPVKKWFAFLAWYLSEGSSEKYTVTIAQRRYRDIVARISIILESVLFNWPII